MKWAVLVAGAVAFGGCSVRDVKAPCSRGEGGAGRALSYLPEQRPIEMPEAMRLEHNASSDCGPLRPINVF
jgi:hypothetical protein